MVSGRFCAKVLECCPPLFECQVKGKEEKHPVKQAEYNPLTCMNVHVPTYHINEHGDVGVLYKTMSLEAAIKGGQVVGLSLTGELIFLRQKRSARNGSKSNA